MNKRQTRLFAIVSSTIAAVVFLGLTIDSHRQFSQLTKANNITPAVTHGKDVWHANNCVNCHTLFGEGAYYAPDLTKITKLRGEAYLTAYLHDPSRFYNEATQRRLMPKQNLSDRDISDLIAFLDWVSNVDNQGWPPRPLLVTGAAMPAAIASAEQTAKGTMQMSGGGTASGTKDPVALGEQVFRTATPACVACHSTAPGVNMAGPSLAGVSSRAEKLLTSGQYTGKAKDVAGYIRESIMQPSAYVVPGPMYSANGVSFMPTTFAKDLTPEQIDALVAYLSTLK